MELLQGRLDQAQGSREKEPTARQKKAAARNMGQPRANRKPGAKKAPPKSARATATTRGQGRGQERASAVDQDGAVPTSHRAGHRRALQDEPGRAHRRARPGPHLVDLLDAAIGPITAIRATGDPRRWIELTCEHNNGALSGSVRVPRPRARIELLGQAEELIFDTAGIDHEECWPVLRAEFAAAVRSGRPGELDARQGLRLQELIEVARR